MRRDGIAPLRMRTQRLWGTRFDTPRAVVRWLTALQAQEFPMAKWSVAQRTRGASQADVDQAFADGVIVRTHVLRPTWHFALGEDIRWLLKATAPRVNALTAYYNRQHKLDTKLFAKSNSIIAPATLNDFTRWSSVTAAEGREALALVGKSLESEVIGGRTFWFGSAPPPRASTSRKPRVDLVQGYDGIIMSYSESRGASFTPVDSRLLHAVLLDGRMIGKWKPVARRNWVVLRRVWAGPSHGARRAPWAPQSTPTPGSAGVPWPVPRHRGK